MEQPLPPEAVDEGAGSVRPHDDAYTRRLHRDIDATTKILERTHIVIATLERKVAEIQARADPRTFDKLRLVALHESSGQIPYTSSKEQVIDNAQASCFFQDHNIAKREFTEWLLSQSNDDSRSDKLLSKFRAIASYCDSESQQIRLQVGKVEARLALLTSDPETYTTNIMRNVDSLLDQSQDWDARLVSHTRRILLKFLASHTWHASETLVDPQGVQGIVHNLMNVIGTLLDSQPSMWHSTKLDEHIKGLLLFLESNDLIDLRRDFVSGWTYRLRDFGGI